MFYVFITIVAVCVLTFLVLLAREASNKIKEEQKEEPMKSLLIKDTTREERAQIVAESLGNIAGTCDGCAAGVAEMYEEYIDGKKEIRDINMEYRARYVSGMEVPEKSNCPME